MTRRSILLIVSFLLFCLPSWAQEMVPAQKDVDLSDEQAIVSQEQMVVREVNVRIQKIQENLEDLERRQLSSDENSMRKETAAEKIAVEKTEEPQRGAISSSEEIAKKPTCVIHGNYRTEFAQRIYRPMELTKLKNQLTLAARGELSPLLRYRISGWAYYDAAYDIGDHYSSSARSDQRAEVELRDAYLDYSFGPWDMRLGKQQVVWGEAVGVFVADVVNAKDLRELTLPDFDSIRIPEWGMDLEYTQDNFHSEFVFLPGVEFDRLGVSGSEFALSLPLPPDTLATFHDAKEPKDGFENSKIGTRISYLWEGLDTGLFYLHSWTSSPVLFRTIDSGIYDFAPEYRRLDIFGATVSKEIHDIVFKGDFVYTKDDFFPVIDAGDADGVVRSGRLEYLLGADYTFFEKLDVNIQFIQEVIVDHTETMVDQDKFNNSFSLRLSRNFWNRKLQAEFLTIYGLNAPDFYYQPKVRYDLTDNWQVSVGADIFAGHSSGVFGYFRDQSRYFSQLVYKF